MKKIISIIKNIAMPVFLLMLLSFISCTKDFEKYNTRNTGLTDEQLMADFNYIGGLFPGIQETYTAVNINPMLFGYFFVAGSFSGYVASNAANPRYGNYQMNMPAWDANNIFNISYNSIMAPINEINRRGAKTLSPDFWAISKILRVAGMYIITDNYGPIPYSQFGKGGTSVSYDKQEDVYNSFFSELDSAVIALKAYQAVYPTSKPFKNFDEIYGGDYNKWIIYANTLRLRLAMHIVKRNPTKAKQMAEKAVSDGVMTSNSDNAILKNINQNALWVAALNYINIMANEAIISYMDGYKDPRISLYFGFSTIPNYTDKYIGIRQGASILARQLVYSNLSPNFVSTTSPTLIITSADAYFLRAEGALRGWNMGGGTAKQYYETGILTSFTQYGLASAANNYINNSTNKPGNCIDPVYPVNNIPALSDITILWDETATNEKKLERIITQKWLAGFPDCAEGWTTFRRTGYPKLFPVKVNNSAGLISTEIQIRRQPYPATEKNNNPTGYVQGVSLLKSEKGTSLPGETTNTGDDTGGTRVWWDVGGPNF